MFDEAEKEQIPLIIVCEDKWLRIGELIKSLISQKDDIDGKIVGTKDDTVSAAIFSPEQYHDSLAEIPSDTHCLFIGDFKAANDQIINIEKKGFIFDKYGMRYGWLGKSAVINVEKKTLSKKDYEQFLEFAKKYQTAFEKANVKLVDLLSNKKMWISVFLPVVYPVAIHGLASDVKQKIREQQYDCLALVLYNEGLQKFMEN